MDFVGLPIALTLEDTTGATQHVSGLPANGLSKIAQGLQAQTAKDGRRWSSLIVNRKNGQLLRILSPNSGILLNPSWFQTYWTNYVNDVYNKYTSAPLTIDTQASYGNVNGQVSGGNLNFGAGGTFPKPSAADIFSCSTGPFATGANGETNTIIPRLSAAFNRSTLLLSNNLPDGVGPRQYYTNPTTNVSQSYCHTHFATRHTDVLCSTTRASYTQQTSTATATPSHTTTSHQMVAFRRRERCSAILQHTWRSL